MMCASLTLFAVLLWAAQAEAQIHTFAMLLFAAAVTACKNNSSTSLYGINLEASPLIVDDYLTDVPGPCVCTVS